MRSGLAWARGRLAAARTFLWARLAERSTLGDIVVAIGAGAAAPHPFNLAMIAVGLVKALVPDGKVGGR